MNIHSVGQVVFDFLGGLPIRVRHGRLDAGPTTSTWPASHAVAAGKRRHRADLLRLGEWFLEQFIRSFDEPPTELTLEAAPYFPSG